MPPTSTSAQRSNIAGEVESKGLRTSAARADDESWRCNLVDPSVLLGPRGAEWFTGKHPRDCKGFEPARGTLGSLSDLSTKEGVTRQDVMDRVDNLWTLTEVLFSGLQGEEAFYRPPYHHTRHPLVFYYAHTAVVYVNKMRVAGLIKDPVNPDFECLFETGVDEMSWDDLSKNDVLWPRIAEATAYRRTVYGLVRDAVMTHPCFDDPITPLNPAWAVYMGIAHDQIHLETSSVLFRELPLRLLRAPEFWPKPHGGASDSEDSSSAATAAAHPPREGVDYPKTMDLIDVARGSVELGRPAAAAAFGWDNEFGSRTVGVAPFKASRCKITNGAFWEFVSGHGYRDDTWWTEEGRAWRVFRNVKWPTFWVPHGPAGLHQYKLRTIFSVVDMRWDWPAVVNVHEARAYCAWFRATKLGEQLRGDHAARLPCEAEMRLVCGDEWYADGARDPALLQGSAAFRETGTVRANVNLAFGSECPVEHLPPNKLGFRDAAGNVWDWTEDHFNPLDGFKVNYLYDDFSTPCFDGKHNVILGGSFVSTGNLASAYSRYHFRPHFFQHAGFRVVVVPQDQPDCAFRFTEQDDAEVVAGADERVAAEWLPIDECGEQGKIARLSAPHDWHQAIASVVSRHLPADRRTAALDVGCGTGRIALQLAAAPLCFRRVVGVDIDDALVARARRALDTGSVSIPWGSVGPGRGRNDPCSGGDALVVPAPRPAAAADTTAAGAPAAVEFRHMDACCLAPDLPRCDAVLLLDVLTHTMSPRAVLGRLGGSRGLVAPGGIVVVADTWNWSEKRSPPGTWLGGQCDADGNWVDSNTALAEALSADFDKVAVETVPRVIPVHAPAVFQLSVPTVSIWRRKDH